jgi:hypothetical protein
LKIIGKMKYETGKAGLLKVLRKMGTLAPIRTIYKEKNILSTTKGLKKCNSGYARRIKPRLGTACNW